MNNRLPPAWSKHLKVRPRTQDIVAQRATPPLRAPSDDILLRQALEYQKDEHYAEAQELCLRVLMRTPNHPLALYILGTLCLGFDDELSLRYFARTVGEEPDNPHYHLTLGEAYLRVGEYSPAIKHMEYALKLKPDLVEAIFSLGRTYLEFDKADLALALYEKARNIAPSHPQTRIGMARALTSLGRMDEASTYLRDSIARNIAIPAAYNELAQTNRFTEEPAELQSILQELCDAKIDSNGAQQLHSAAGKILNDLKRYQEAFYHFRKAKEVTGYKFDIESYRTWVDSMIEVFTPDLLAARSHYGTSSEIPVFVVGMPRSGTTLTEQICASHPYVHGAGELSKLSRVANAIGLRKTLVADLRRSVLSITADLSRTLAEEHLSYLRERAPGAVRIVDKMPHNFELIGLIGLLFPNARIIHCRRDAIDNCVSCFVLNFNEAHSYNSDLRILGLYYREYDRLMRHWQKLFPGLIFESRYETLIENQEAQSRELIDHLGLPWDDACLRFFERDGSVNTPSRWQVRQPIYKSSVKRWKNYESEIQPLIESLGDLADV